MISALAPFDAIAEEEHHDMGAVGTNLANPLGTLWNLSFNIEPFKTKENMSEKKQKIMEANANEKYGIITSASDLPKNGYIPNAEKGEIT